MKVMQALGPVTSVTKKTAKIMKHLKVELIPMSMRLRTPKDGRRAEDSELWGSVKGLFLKRNDWAIFSRRSVQFGLIAAMKGCMHGLVICRLLIGLAKPRTSRSDDLVSLVCCYQRKSLCALLDCCALTWIIVSIVIYCMGAFHFATDRDYIFILDLNITSRWLHTCILW